MKLLLDTHVLVWLAEGLDALPPRSRKLIDQASRSEGVTVSAISFWEVAMLSGRGRISLSKPLRSWREQILESATIAEVGVDGAIGIEAVQLPGRFHEDPADRILAATARLHGARLATRDQRLLAYGKAGHIAAVKV